MDPTFLVGIGPMYSDEILFHAGLRYDRSAQSLSAQEIRRLYRAVVETSTTRSSTAARRSGRTAGSACRGKPGEYQQYTRPSTSVTAR